MAIYNYKPELLIRDENAIFYTDIIDYNCQHRTGRAWCFEQKQKFCKKFYLMLFQPLIAKNLLWLYPHFRTDHAHSRKGKECVCFSRSEFTIYRVFSDAL